MWGPIGLQQRRSLGTRGTLTTAAAGPDLDEGGDGGGVATVGGVHERRAALVQVRLLHRRVIPEAATTALEAFATMPLHVRTQSAWADPATL